MNAILAARTARSPTAPRPKPLRQRRLPRPPSGAAVMVAGAVIAAIALRERQTTAPKALSDGLPSARSVGNAQLKESGHVFLGDARLRDANRTQCQHVRGRGESTVCVIRRN